MGPARCALTELPDGAAAALLSILSWRDARALMVLNRSSTLSALRQRFFSSRSWEVPPWLPFATTLVASLSMAPFITSVSIADPSFEPLLSSFPRLRVVRVLDKHEDVELSGQLIPASVTRLDLRPAHFDSVECLAPLTQLKCLELDLDRVQDFSVIGGMRQLEELNLAGSSVQSIGFVAETPKLRMLDVSRTKMLSDLSPLSSLQLLEELGVAEKEIDNLEWLRPLAVSLKVLKASKLKVTGSSAVSNQAILASLANLERLEINNSVVISSFEPIRSLSKLKHLNVTGLNIGNMHGLGALSQLETLSLDMTESSDWTVLRGLSGLKQLDQDGIFASQRPPPEAQVLREMPHLQVLTCAVYLTQRVAMLNIRELSVHSVATSGDNDVTAALWHVPFLEKLTIWGECNIENVAKYAPQLKHFSLAPLVSEGRSVSTVLDAYYAPLGRLKRLQSLTLNGTYQAFERSRQDRFRWLKRLINMEDLDLEKQPIADLSVLSRMKKLGRLILAGTRVHDVAPLRKLEKLEALDLGNSLVVDVSALVGHPRLRLLGLPNKAACWPLTAEYGVTLPGIKKIWHPKLDCLWTQHKEGIVDVSVLFDAEEE